MEHQKQRSYGRMVLLLLGALCLSACLAFVLRPLPNPEEKAKIKEVSVTVTKVTDLKFYAGKNTRKYRYEVTLTHQGQEYLLGVQASAPYTVGVEYEMYLYDNTIYRDYKSAVAATVYNHARLPFRVCVGVAFLAGILLIGYGVAFLRDRQSGKSIQSKKSLQPKQPGQTTQSKPPAHSEPEGNLAASVSEIRGGLDYMRVIYDNGYEAKIYGELRPGATFFAYKKSLTNWQPPHEGEQFTEAMREKLLADVNAKQTPSSVRVVFFD